jgi:hypothetical protein
VCVVQVLLLAKTHFLLKAARSAVGEFAIILSSHLLQSNATFDLNMGVSRTRNETLFQKLPPWHAACGRPSDSAAKARGRQRG